MVVINLFFIMCVLRAYIAKTREAASFYSTYETRLDILNSNHGDVVLPSYTFEPYLLYFDDITTEKKDWRNRSFAKWYHVKSVRK